MIERTEQRFGLKPKLLAADTAYGSAPMLNWLVEEKDIAPHIPVIDKSTREDGSFSRADFRYDANDDVYICPADKALQTSGTIVNDEQRLYRGTTADCRSLSAEAALLPEGAGAQDPAQHLRSGAGRRPIAVRHRGLRAVTP